MDSVTELVASCRKLHSSSRGSEVQSGVLVRAYGPPIKIVQGTSTTLNRMALYCESEPKGKDSNNDGSISNPTKIQEHETSAAQKSDRFRS